MLLPGLVRLGARARVELKVRLGLGARLDGSLRVQVVVLYDYEAQGDQELELREGDIVTIVTKEDDVWWCGQTQGRMGMFPSTYVEPYEEK